MMKNFSPLQLMPFIRKEKYADRLVQKYLKASEFQQEQILEKAKLLNRGPILDEFHFPTAHTNETKDLWLFSGYGTATKTILNSNGDLKSEPVKIDQIKAVDKKNRFEFIIEPKEECAFITVCKVNQKHRGKGYFYLMAQSIRDFCFNELKVNTIVGNARPPRTENKSDWRQELVTYRNNFTTGEPVKLSRLHVLWLNEPFALHGKILGSEDAESFAFLNPEQLKEFSVEDFEEWDITCPKKNKANTFKELMCGKEAA